jgi:hypothetical protein
VIVSTIKLKKITVCAKIKHFAVFLYKLMKSASFFATYFPLGLLIILCRVRLKVIVISHLYLSECLSVLFALVMRVSVRFSLGLLVRFSNYAECYSNIKYYRVNEAAFVLTLTLVECAQLSSKLTTESIHVGCNTICT